MEVSRYSVPVSRASTIVLGIIVTLLGTALLVFFGLGVYSLTRGFPSSSVIVILLIAGAVGLGLCVVGVRLVTGKRRRDGGLFSPWTLRFAAVIFLFGPVAFVLNRSWFGLIEAGFSLSAAVACFVLANRREEAAADQERLTIVGGDRDAR
jgi:hypothetical protein